MNTLHIVPVYAALLTFLFLILSFRAVRMRAKHNIPIGDAQNSEMLRAMRVHSNFAEYVPLALILFSMLEMKGPPSKLIHGLCATFLVARIIHAYGVSQKNEKFIFRLLGMVPTFTTMAIASVYLMIR